MAGANDKVNGGANGGPGRGTPAAGKPEPKKPRPGGAVLGCYSNFSFLHGGSHPREMVETAAELGWGAIGIADINSLAGVVRAHVAAREAGIRLVVGARLRPADGPDVIAHPMDIEGYQSLSALLSWANLRGTKAAPVLHLCDLEQLSARTALLVMPPEHPDAGHAMQLGRIREIAGGEVFAGATLLRDGGDEARLAMLGEMAAGQKLPLVAAGDALYHTPARRPLADVLCCIREAKRIDEAGEMLSRNAERHLLEPDEMARRWRRAPGALANAAELAGMCGFAMDELKYEYPCEVDGGEPDAVDELERQTWIGAGRRYPGGTPRKVEAILKREIALIRKLNFASYFLTVFDIVRFARSRGILCQGRGSAANSAVCYCMGITSVDPQVSHPLFERFISEARGEPPDIDVDFEHERREEVIQYIYEKYGRERAGLAATVITYRSKSALREVARVFGLGSDVQSALSGQVWGRGRSGIDDSALAEAGIDPADRRIGLVRRIVADIAGFPRHLSQHVGGFVITRDRLDHLCPIGPAAMDGRTVIEWDKDDLDALGILKVDVLALGMLSCIRRAFALIGAHYGREFDLSNLPSEDPATYDMLCEGRSVGVFQVESRAQMSMLPRLRPRCFHDLVVQVAIVRPGPIQGNMVHPYLKRRADPEKVEYPSPELRKVLERTLGVPIFQEQAMQIAMVGAGFTGDEADQLRRSMATFSKHGDVSSFRDKLVGGMIERGYEREFAERCFRQIEGFGTYGFPESHAASFALLVYVSAWIKRHYPDVFVCALINSQPMGFYSPSQLVAEARRNGIEVREADVGHSNWDCTLEPCPVGTTGSGVPGGSGGSGGATGSSGVAGQGADTGSGERCAIRLGLRLVKGLSRDDGERIAANRKSGYGDLADIMKRADIPAKALEAIARSDGFRSLGLDRRRALWEVRALGKRRFHELPLFATAAAGGAQPIMKEPDVALPAEARGEQVAADYRSLGLSLKAHPMALLARPLSKDGWLNCAGALDALDGAKLRLAGLVTMRQRPGTASGTVFVTLEDGLHSLNVIVWPKLTETYREALLGSQILGVVGKIQRAGPVLHFIAESLFNLNGYLFHLDEDAGRNRHGTRMRSRDFR